MVDICFCRVDFRCVWTKTLSAHPCSGCYWSLHEVLSITGKPNLRGLKRILNKTNFDFGKRKKIEKTNKPERLQNHPEIEKRRQWTSNVWLNSFIFFNIRFKPLRLGYLCFLGCILLGLFRNRNSWNDQIILPFYRAWVDYRHVRTSWQWHYEGFTDILESAIAGAHYPYNEQLDYLYGYSVS